MEQLQSGVNNEIITRLGAIPYFYHLSPVKGIKALEPRTNKYSEKNLPIHKKSRVCLADTIHGCIQSLYLPGWDKEFNFEDDTRMKHLQNAQISKGVYEPCIS